MKKYIKAEAIIRKQTVASMLMSSFIQGTTIMNGSEALSKQSVTWEEEDSEE